VVEGDRLKVTYASPGSPAEAAGWKKGEEITAIDGRPITAAFHGSELSRWRFGPAGKTVSFTLADGSKRSLTLKDYF
jgi:S1-C subfamily serine protease